MGDGGIVNDFSELNELVRDLEHGGLLAGVRAAKVVEDSSQRVEDQAKEWAPRKRVPHYARTITHDVTVGAGSIVGEIGPDADVNGQAKLAPIFEYGVASRGFAARAHMGPALDREIPNFIDGLGDAAGRIL